MLKKSILSISAFLLVFSLFTSSSLMAQDAPKEKPVKHVCADACKDGCTAVKVESKCAADCKCEKCTAKAVEKKCTECCKCEKCTAKAKATSESNTKGCCSASKKKA